MLVAMTVAIVVLQGLPWADGLTSVRTERLKSGHLLVIGVDSEKLAVVRVVDTTTGRVRAEAKGLSPRWFPAAEYVLLRRDGRFYAFHVNTGAVEGPLSEDEVLARSIRYGSGIDRRVTLQRLTTGAKLRDGPLVREALLERLRQEVSRPLPAPTDEMAKRVRRTRERELELLVDVIGQTRLPEAAPLVAAAGVSAGALINIGKPSIPAIFEAWRKLPQDASPLHRFRLLTALRQLVNVFPDAAIPEVGQLVREVLQRPPDVESLKEAIRFADDLDDESALRQVKMYAEDASFVAGRVSPADADEVRKTARRVLDRRITIR